MTERECFESNREQNGLTITEQHTLNAIIKATTDTYPADLIAHINKRKSEEGYCMEAFIAYVVEWIKAQRPVYEDPTEKAEREVSIADAAADRSLGWLRKGVKAYPAEDGAGGNEGDEIGLVYLIEERGDRSVGIPDTSWLELRQDEKQRARFAAALSVTPPTIRIFPDGDKWCAVGPKFENLQESPAGFGDNPEEALKYLWEDASYHEDAELIALLKGKA